MVMIVDISNLPSAHISETEFQAHVIQIAEMYGWLCYHTYDSRRSEPGFPDLVLAHEDYGQIFAELKTDRGRVSADQARWAVRLQSAEGKPFAARYRLWRPRDLDTVASELAGNFIVETTERTDG